ncbi:SatD family protein [Fodinibius sp. AD559]|uniref:SatD family protein n=1 Tax=Fodinibius sp. AD559 TaxID=3424179 RepID=UPI004046FAC9
MEKLLVLIGDIEDSQSIQNGDREVLQEVLSNELQALNAEYKEGIISPYTITLGDEFQAVFNRADAVFVQMLKIMSAIYPTGVRFSLAVGDINTPVNTEQAIGMDGPAFHQARRGVELLKENGHIFNIGFKDDDSPGLKIINNSLQLLSDRMRGWNKKRLVILHMMKEGYDYKEISEALEISKPAFYKNKDAGMLDVVDELSDNITDIINEKLK